MNPEQNKKTDIQYNLQAIFYFEYQFQLVKRLHCVIFVLMNSDLCDLSRADFSFVAIKLAAISQTVAPFRVSK